MQDKPLWWQQTTFYQIYMPAFVQENGSTFTFLRDKLPYYESLGIKGIWLTPFYPSPKVDNGYDVSDYENVASEYGTLEEFDQFIKCAHQRGIRVIADVVLNHTSDKHPWFQESLQEDSEKADWYVWSKEIPNNWESFFGGSAWEWREERKAYYYHSFAKEQADLNFHKQAVVEAVLEVLTFWFDKGIDGFRLDVINNLTVGSLCKDNPVGADGKQNHVHDVNQAGIENILEAIRQKTDAISDNKAFLVGEISSEELPLIHHYASEELLHTTFNFNLGSREHFEISEFYAEIKAVQQLYGKEYPTLFFGSHDMRRFPSRFDMNERQIKIVSLFQLTFRGIPFLYYGEEIGMRDKVYRSLSDAKDCQALLAYEEVKEQGGSEEEAMEALRAKSRDYSRGAMDWEEVERQQTNPDSLFSFYRNLIALRNRETALQIGECTMPESQDGVICYDRIEGERHMRILINATNKEQSLDKWRLKGTPPIFATDEACSDEILGAMSGAIYKIVHFL